MSENLEELRKLGYSIAELWGTGRPISRGTSAIRSRHLMLWGILSIVEYQVDRGAGHRYLRERLVNGDWIAIGYAKRGDNPSKPVRVPPIHDAQFGKAHSAIGNASTEYVDVRILNAELFDGAP